jgi:organic hydroperoxide reductase OsmC/OhrA
MKWTGNTGRGTEDYTSYKRDFEIKSKGKLLIQGSSDAVFRGNPEKYNPEDMLVASLSSCHMLWYLHLCSKAKITVTEYFDTPIGYMAEADDGSGRFTEIKLKPVVIIYQQDKVSLAYELHQQAHKMCFIANSVNFSVIINPTITSKQTEKTRDTFSE